MSLIHLANYCAHLRNCINATHAKTSIPYTRLLLQASLGLYKQGFISSIQKGSVQGPDQVPTDVTSDNISTRRLWLDLKYRNNVPVIRGINVISKPGRKIYLRSDEIKALASGFPVRKISALEPAESIFIRCGTEVLEVQDAAKRNLDGEPLFRVK
ncbi:uncharacterized protein J8A68_001023 [[Candida] subhashii]|uniref:Ribosomal protein S8 n=1 Tax=[Candida] subhashii TaxID=561895 RepID=A0A8J5R4M8_9ASCO|nr:uncharacterized protein J8A68_001023 [[Candida] subhashii]KAG7665335.1 hypothetical protein J8A68_001023 [[Candida] subhashii]